MNLGGNNYKYVNATLAPYEISVTDKTQSSSLAIKLKKMCRPTTANSYSVAPREKEGRSNKHGVFLGQSFRFGKKIRKTSSKYEGVRN